MTNICCHFAIGEVQLDVDLINLLKSFHELSKDIFSAYFKYLIMLVIFDVRLLYGERTAVVAHVSKRYMLASEFLRTYACTPTLNLVDLS